MNSSNHVECNNTDRHQQTNLTNKNILKANLWYNVKPSGHVLLIKCPIKLDWARVSQQIISVQKKHRKMKHQVACVNNV